MFLSVKIVFRNKGYAGLEDALKFFSETQDFGIIGNSILRFADLFFIKHNYMIHTLEDVIIPDILNAIDSRAYISLETFSADKASGKEKKPPLAVPMQILVSVQTGRRYLANPFWDEEHERRSRISARIELLFTAEQIKDTAEVIQSEIEKRLQYDEYRYQLENRIIIDTPGRAEGLHLPLYKCMSCKTEGKMTSSGAVLKCTSCGSTWELTELGQLKNTENGELFHIPDWYRWERNETEKEIREGSYSSDSKVTIEALPNEKGFVSLGTGRLIHDSSGYRLVPDNTDQAAVKNSPDSFPIIIKPHTLESVQTEYNYRGRGKCIVISTRSCCYYCYGRSPDLIVTKQEFAQEYFYKEARKK